MDEEELFGPVPEPLGSHRPGAAGAIDMVSTLGVPNKLWIGAGGAAYRAINIIPAAARRLLGLEAEPANPWAIGAVEHRDEDTKARRAARTWAALRRAWEWLPLTSVSFPRPDPAPIRPGEPLDALQSQRLRKEMSRSAMLRRLAINPKLVMKCLDHYNSMHPGNEYEAAPGVVTKYSQFYDGQCWTHGNFVACRKHSGFFSFLPTARTLFFFELLVRADFKGIVTCTPLDEPVTEAYTFLGFPLGWGTRRNGSSDCICETCYRHCHVPHRGMKKTFACGHDKVEAVCDMCYRCSGVLHPIPVPGESAFAFRDT